MKYINKNTGESISEYTYLQLTDEGKKNFVEKVKDKKIKTKNCEYHWSDSCDCMGKYCGHE